MIRLTMASVAWLSLVSTASAGLSSAQGPSLALGERLPAEMIVRLMQDPTTQTTRRNASASKDEFIITERTEVQLDGRPCRYGDVPPRSAIVLLEVGPDGKTVLKVHFRTRK